MDFWVVGFFAHGFIRGLLVGAFSAADLFAGFRLAGGKIREDLPIVSKKISTPGVVNQTPDFSRFRIKKNTRKLHLLHTFERP